MPHTTRFLIVASLITVLGCGGGGGSGGDDPAGGDPTGACSEAGREIVTLLNQYRGENGLPAIALSPSLCVVANAHVQDLADNRPQDGAGCNLHSWSSAGSWSSCCYTPDHAQAACMWSKPAELTSYPGNGYENAASGATSAADAMTLWKGSAAHNAVMLNQDIWTTFTWRAVGAALHDGYAVLWFGAEVDPGL